jgi:hypothetical protein
MINHFCGLVWFSVCMSMTGVFVLYEQEISVASDLLQIGALVVCLPWAITRCCSSCCSGYFWIPILIVHLFVLCVWGATLIFITQYFDSLVGFRISRLMFVCLICPSAMYALVLSLSPRVCRQWTWLYVFGPIWLVYVGSLVYMEYWGSGFDTYLIRVMQYSDEAGVLFSELDILSALTVFIFLVLPPTYNVVHSVLLCEIHHVPPKNQRDMIKVLVVTVDICLSLSIAIVLLFGYKIYCLLKKHNPFQAGNTRGFSPLELQ